MTFAVPTDFSNTSSVQYEPIPADNHVAVCIGILDLGTHMESYKGDPPKPQRKVKVQFEIPGVVREDGKAGIISSTYNCSMNEKATFRKTLDTWLGADWPEKYRGQPWSFLIGQPAMVLTQQGPSKRDPSRVSAWIGSVSKFPKGMPAPKPTRDTFYLDLTDKTLPAILSFWDAQKIRESKEYLAGGFVDNAPTEQGGGNGQQPPPPPRQAPAGPASSPPECPPEVLPLLGKYGLTFPYSADDLDIRVDDIAPKHMALLLEHTCPF